MTNTLTTSDSTVPSKTRCPFCHIDPDAIIDANDTCIAFLDLKPVAPGHLLIIPKRHCRTYFDLTEREKQDMDELLQNGKARLDNTTHPDGYNIGFNCGVAAGQTIFHCHAHLIPRFNGDTANPAGGVRGVIPKQQHEE